MRSSWTLRSKAARSVHMAGGSFEFRGCLDEHFHDACLRNRELRLDLGIAKGRSLFCSSATSSTLGSSEALMCPRRTACLKMLRIMTVLGAWSERYPDMTARPIQFRALLFIDDMHFVISQSGCSVCTPPVDMVVWFQRVDRCDDILAEELDHISFQYSIVGNVSGKLGQMRPSGNFCIVKILARRLVEEIIVGEITVLGSP